MKLITAPDREPITLDEARDQCRVDGEQDDTYLETLIAVARRYVETVTRRALVTQTWEMALWRWPGIRGFPVPKPPLQSVTSIIYQLENASLVTLPTTEYVVAAHGEPGWIVLNNGKSWPNNALFVAEPIKVRWVCGWGDTDDIPAEIKHAMRLLVGHWYENREQVVLTVGLLPSGTSIPLGIDALLETYRMPRFSTLKEIMCA